ncbi:MAG: bacteriocin, partial [Erysipelotrichaceae bacterium]|nr:bacteriocin [Erysipelotrichaceae bacterium]
LKQNALIDSKKTIKEEFETIATKLSELNEDELKEISGGMRNVIEALKNQLTPLNQGLISFKNNKKPVISVLRQSQKDADAVRFVKDEDAILTEKDPGKDVM